MPFGTLRGKQGGNGFDMRNDILCELPYLEDTLENLRFSSFPFKVATVARPQGNLLDYTLY